MNSFQIKQALIDSVNNQRFIIKSVLIGAHLTAVESKHLGLAATVIDRCPGLRAVEEAGSLENLPIDQIVAMIHSDIMLKASLGMAALNSLIELPQKYSVGNAFEIIQRLAEQKNIGVIGHFPFVDKLQPIARTCRVFEQSPGDGDLPAIEIPNYLPRCDLVVITAQTITNGSISKILEYSKHAFKILLGPSAPLSPVLFDFGIDLIGGARVIDAEAVKRHITQGACFKQLPGVQLLSIRKAK